MPKDGQTERYTSQCKDNCTLCNIQQAFIYLFYLFVKIYSDLKEAESHTVINTTTF